MTSMSYQIWIQLDHRDRWLSPGGIMLPDFARLSICAFSNRDYYEQQRQVSLFASKCYLNLGLDCRYLVTESMYETSISYIAMTLWPRRRPRYPPKSAMNALLS